MRDDLAASGRRLRVLTLNLTAKSAAAADIVDYKYDTAKSSWCELTLSFDLDKKMLDMSNIIRKAAEQGVVYEVGNSDLLLVSEVDRGLLQLCTP